MPILSCLPPPLGRQQSAPLPGAMLRAWKGPPPTLRLPSTSVVVQGPQGPQGLRDLEEIHGAQGAQGRHGDSVANRISFDPTPTGAPTQPPPTAVGQDLHDISESPPRPGIMVRSAPLFHPPVQLSHTSPTVTSSNHLSQH